MNFLNRKTLEDEEPLSDSKKRHWCSVGAAINYSLAVHYLAIFITCLFVVGTVGTIQKDLKDEYDDPFNITGPFCYMYSDCDGDINVDNQTNCSFLPDTVSKCDATLVCHSFIAVMALAFAISMIIKGFINQDLNQTLYIELPVLIMAAILEFSLSVVISVGSSMTRNSVEEFDGKSDKYPCSDVSYKERATVAESSAWFAFLFIVIALVITIIRLNVFLRRRKKEVIRNTIE